MPEEEAGGDVSGMPDEGVGTGVDDRVTTVGLDADGRLEELVHRLRPGQARQPGDQQTYPIPQAHQGTWDQWYRPSSRAATGRIETIAGIECPATTGPSPSSPHGG